MGKIKIDFQVLETKNPQLLMVSDNSEWDYAEDLNAWITIILPGSTKKLTFAFKKHSIEQFNSHNLGISCFRGDCEEEEYTDLPDGIYTICLKSGYEGIDKKRYYLKTDRFDIDFAKVVVKNGLEYNEEDREFRDKILDVMWFAMTAKSHTIEGNFSEAKYWFEKAKNKLNIFKDCKNCG